MRFKALLVLSLAVAAIIIIRWQNVEGGVIAASRTSQLPQVGTATATATSLDVRDLTRKQEKRPDPQTFSTINNERSPVANVYPNSAKRSSEASLAQLALAPMPAPTLTFEGLSNYDNIALYNAVYIPPDVTGDIGPQHYVQAINALVRIFDKSGNALTPPFKMSDLFAPLGTVCSTRNDGNPIVLYDPLADRWMLSQFCSAFPPFRQMIAVSKTGDPTGSYFLYEFAMPNVKINDFPKFGVWTDGYYMSTEEFLGSDYVGTGMFAFDRSKMLVGDPSANYIYFTRPSFSTARLGNILPSDLDGLRPPPNNSPNVFASFSADEYGDPVDAIRLFDFHADFVNPSSSTFTEREESPLAVAAFDPTSTSGRADISQPAPGEMLDSNSDRLNFRLAYRNFGSSEDLVVNQTVRLSPSEPYRAGVRVYVLKRSGGSFAVTEQSTIGDPTSSRWIGSVAQDNQGNLAVGYNFVNEIKEPSILYSGKLASEPSGTFRTEGTLIGGTGVQKAFGFRWGDYAGMSVDPVDDCTFWQTGQYFTQASEDFSDFTWLTRIGKFKFDECTAAPRAVITGSVSNAANGQPVANATVSAGQYSRSSAVDGGYGNMALIPGNYTLTASARGFLPQTVSVNPTNGQTITQNFALQPIPLFETPETTVAGESCGRNGSPDPGENVVVNIGLRNTGSAATQSLIVELLAGGGVTNPGAVQSYGPMPVNGPLVVKPFSFTVSNSVSCGSPITLTFGLRDGAQSLGNLVITLQTGKPKIAFAQNFDRTQMSTLPKRWTRFGTVNAVVPWAVSQIHSRSTPKAAFSFGSNQAGLNEMTSPVFSVNTATAKLSFQHLYDLETTFLRNRLYDGSLLEIKIGDGNWQDIIAAGGVFETGGYDGLIDACCQNPLAGRPGWSGRSGINQAAEFVTVTVRLPQAAAGQQVQFRWRIGTDIGNSRATEGQFIDDVSVSDGFVCGCTN